MNHSNVRDTSHNRKLLNAQIKHTNTKHKCDDNHNMRNATCETEEQTCAEFKHTYHKSIRLALQAHGMPRSADSNKQCELLCHKNDWAHSLGIAQSTSSNCSRAPASSWRAVATAYFPSSSSSSSSASCWWWWPSKVGLSRYTLGLT